MTEPGREPMEHPERGEAQRPSGAARYEPIRYLDIVRWGPVFAGVFTALAIMTMLSFLGVAIGMSTASVGVSGIAIVAAPAIWTIISLIIGLFFGGWLAAATSGPTGVWDGVYHGVVVWGLTVFLIAIASGLGLAGLIGTFAVTDPAVVASVFWGYFFASLLGLAAAIVGGIVGASREEASRS